MNDLTKPWIAKLDNLITGFDFGDPTRGDGTCMVQMVVDPITGHITVTQIKHWRKNETESMEAFALAVTADVTAALGIGDGGDTGVQNSQPAGYPAPGEHVCSSPDFHCMVCRLGNRVLDRFNRP